MKKLKLEHELAQQILSGERRSTWRLFDDKDLSVNDEVLLIDKVDPEEPETWKTIGLATIDRVVERRVDDIGDEEMHDHGFTSRANMLNVFRRYYGADVGSQTALKMIFFRFSPHVPIIKDTDILPRPEKVTIYADGGSRGNPGPSASGFVIYDMEQNMLVNRGIYLGVTTNNQAEYTALKLALEEAKTLGAHEAHVYMDSLLVINQMRGLFKVKNRDLWPIHEAVKQLCTEFRKVDFTQVPRESNKLADAAVNTALDAHQHNNTP